jgi:hypothetical protein
LKDISFHASKGIQISDPAGGPVPPATGQGQAVRYNRAGHHQVDGEFTISRFPSLGSRVQILATAPKFLPRLSSFKKSQFNDIGDKSPSDGGSLIFAAPFLRTPVFALQNFSNLAPYN